jgi:threonine/homoserine/homoserine lactone efflux protein
VWALIAVAGFAVLVAASEAAYLVLRVVGAIVLLHLGTRAWSAAPARPGEGRAGST